jgi:hypothetical protein
MTKIRFGDTSPETLRAFDVTKKAEHIKRFGYASYYSEQRAYLRDVLGERSPGFNRVWGEGW